MKHRFLFALTALLLCITACGSSTVEQTATVVATTAVVATATQQLAPAYATQTAIKATVNAEATDMYRDFEEYIITPTANARMLAPCSGSEVVRMVWDTSGGGDMRFVIDKEETGYRLRIVRYDFETVDQEISFADAPASVQLIVDTIFATPTYLLKFRDNPDVITGTWTTISVVCIDTQEVSYDSLDSTSMSSLYNFVDQAMQALEPTP